MRLCETEGCHGPTRTPLAKFCVKCVARKREIHDLRNRARRLGETRLARNAGWCITEACSNESSSIRAKYCAACAAQRNRDCAKRNRGSGRSRAGRFSKTHCGRCGLRPECLGVLDVDRIIPGEDGGEYIEGNVQILCANCHRLRHRDPAAFLVREAKW